MSLYTIAAANLTTADDRRRRPAVDGGQITRTLVLCLFVAVGLAGAQRAAHSGAAPVGAAATIEH